MTTVTIHKSNDKTIGFVIDGHVGFADFGKDIVCASLSLLAYTAINSLNIVAELKEEDVNYEIDEEAGFLKVETKNTTNDKSDVIYGSFLVGVQLLEESYGDFVTLITEEV